MAGEAFCKPVWGGRWCAASLAALLASCSATWADVHDNDDLEALVLPARVVRVVDGDTIVVQLQQQQMSVRLFGVDAPERNQLHGSAATKALTLLVGRKEVELAPVEQDRHNRMVARVYVEGLEVNARLVEQGYAWAAPKYLGQVPGGMHYCELEARARAEGRGLWSGARDSWMPPWEFRKKRRTGDRRDYSRETARDCRAAVPASRTASSADPAGVSDGCLIKGNINSRGERIYHVPGSRHYDATRIDPAAGERWFCSEAEAQVEGWRPSR